MLAALTFSGKPSEPLSSEKTASIMFGTGDVRFRSTSLSTFELLPVSPAHELSHMYATGNASLRAHARAS